MKNTYNAELLSLAPDELSELISELTTEQQLLFDQLYSTFISAPEAEKKEINDQIYDLLGLVTDEELESVLEHGMKVCFSQHPTQQRII